MSKLKASIYPFLLFLLPLLLYLHTMPSSLGFQDAGYYLAAVKARGVTYPTGYPLYTMLAIFFSLLPLPIAFTLKVHLLSALASCGTALLTYYALAYAFKSENWLPRRGRELIFFAFSLALVTGKSVWAQSINAEVYALQLLLTALFWTFLLRYIHQGRRFYACVVTLALMLANHMVAVVSLLFFAYVLLWGRKASGAMWAKGAVLGVAILAALYSYLPLRSAALSGTVRNPLLNWGMTEKLGNFFAHVTGSHWTMRGESYTFDPAAILVNLAYGLKVIADAYYLPFFCLFLLGVWVLARSSHLLRKYLLAYLGGHIAINAFFTQSTELANYYFPMFFAVIIISVFGLGFFFRLGEHSARGSRGNFAADAEDGASTVRMLAAKRMVGWVLVALVVLSSLALHPRQLDRSDCHIFRDLGVNLLAPLEKDAVLLAAGDIPLCATAYVQEVEGTRKDVLVLSHPLFSRFAWYREQMNGLIDFAEKGVLYPDLYVRQFLEMNPARQFYITGLDYFEPPFYESYRAIPAGYLYKLVPRGGEISLPDGIWELGRGEARWLFLPVVTTTRAEHDNVNNIKNNTVNFYINYLMSVELVKDADAVKGVIETCRRIEAGIRGGEEDTVVLERLRRKVFGAVRREMGHGNIVQSLTLMLNMLAAYPNNGDAMLYAGNILYESGEKARAARYYRQLLSLSPEHAMRQEIKRRMGEQ